ncbi:MAG: metallophosphoesterase [Planctomycetota bacterium]
MSNLNIDAATAPAIDPAFLQEISLWAPDVLILTGDLVENSSYFMESPARWENIVNRFKSLGFPLVVLAGNHDPIKRYHEIFGPDTGYRRVGDIGLITVHNWIEDPLSKNEAETRRFEEALKAAASDDIRSTVVCCHEEPQYLDPALSRLGALAASARVRLILGGGHRDAQVWFRKPLCLPLSGFPVVQTHEGSTLLRSGATGDPCYRVLDFVGEAPAAAYRGRTVIGGFACLYEGGQTLSFSPGEGRLSSIPAGMIRIVPDGNGCGVWVGNGLDQYLPELRYRVSVPDGSPAPIPSGCRVLAREKSAAGEKALLGFDVPPRVWKHAGLLPQALPYDVGIAIPSDCFWGEATAVTVTITPRGERLEKDFFCVSLGGEWRTFKGFSEFTPGKPVVQEFTFRPHGGVTRRDACTVYSTRHQWTWEKPVDLIAPAETGESAWLVRKDASDRPVIVFQSRVAWNKRGGELVFIPRSAEGGDTKRSSSCDDALAEFVWEPSQFLDKGGDFSGTLWAVWEGGAAPVSQHTCKAVSTRDASFHTLSEMVTEGDITTRTRFRMQKKDADLMLEVLVDEPKPEGLRVKNRPETPANQRTPLWGDDGIELIFEEPLSGKRAHFLVNSAGLFETELKGIEIPAGKVRAERVFTDRGIRFVLTIPDLFPQERMLRMNVFRNRKFQNTSEIQAWVPTQGDMHDNRFWGFLVKP